MSLLCDYLLYYFCLLFLYSFNRVQLSQHHTGLDPQSSQTACCLNRKKPSSYHPKTISVMPWLSSWSLRFCSFWCNCYCSVFGPSFIHMDNITHFVSPASAINEALWIVPVGMKNGAWNQMSFWWSYINLQSCCPLNSVLAHTSKYLYYLAVSMDALAHSFKVSAFSPCASLSHKFSQSTQKQISFASIRFPESKWRIPLVILSE